MEEPQVVVAIRRQIGRTTMTSKMKRRWMMTLRQMSGRETMTMGWTHSSKTLKVSTLECTICERYKIGLRPSNADIEKSNAGMPKYSTASRMRS